MTELAAAVRFVHLAAAVLLAGSYAFVAVVMRRDSDSLFMAPPAARHSPLELLVHRWQRQIVAGCVVAILLSALAALLLQASLLDAASPGPPDFEPGPAKGVAMWPLISETLFGRMMLARMVIALSLWTLVARGAGGTVSAAAFALELVLSFCLLASIALSGHAASSEGMEFLLQAGADALHLIAAGAWLGALPLLVLLLRRCASALDPAAFAVVRLATRNFSRLGIACVGTLLVTGAINAWSLVGGVPQLLGTPYGQVLLLKLSLLVPLLGIAALNLFRINPAIVTDSPESAAFMPRHAQRLSRNAAIEALLGLMILAIVGLLGTTPPARHLQVDWPFGFRWDWLLMDRSPRVKADVEIGLAFMLLAFFILQFVWLYRRARWWTSGAGMALLAYSVTLVLLPVTIDATPTSYRRPEVAYHAISVANGKTLYAEHCASCHGGSGRGDGPAAEGQRPRPSDLAGPRAASHTAGDLFWWISHGIPKSAMQGVGQALDEEERWDLVNFVRALAGGRRAAELGSVVGERPALVAPDFVYATSAGANRTLKEHRGGRLVLLVLTTAETPPDRLWKLDQAAARLAAAGVDIILVPRVPPTPRSLIRLPAVTEGNDEIHETYSIFTAGLPDPKGAKAGVADRDSAQQRGMPHAEFLIDRQGYLRTRWLPVENDAWADPGAVVKQAERLMNEPLRMPAPADHVH